MANAALPGLMERLRDLVRGDGLDLEYQRIDPMSGTLRLRLFAGPAPCAACVMSKDLLEEIALPVAQRADPAIRRVLIQDDRPGPPT